MPFVELKEADEEYSLYRTSHGDLRVRDVALTKGELPQYLPLNDLWKQFEDAMRWALLSPVASVPDFFRAYAQGPLGITTEDIGFCASCQEAYWDDELTEDTEDGYVCDDCYSAKYAQCPCCDKALRKSSLDYDGRHTLAGELVCGSCIDSDYSFCVDCDGYYPDDDADEHDHDPSAGCCESPQPQFTMRNGSELLASGTRTEVALPSRITREGITQIRNLLGMQADPRFSSLAYYAMDELSADWQMRDGNYTKRLSRLAYERFGLKIPPEVLAQVGNIARDNSKAASMEVEVTRDLNMSAGDFYHAGSCWWGSYSESRCALKTNGGLGLRSFSGDEVTGRAWVMPLKLGESGMSRRLRPTFDTEAPAAFVVFNGYGELDRYTAARIVAQMAGWTYAKIEFSCEPMYVNSGGYLVAPEDIVQEFKRGLRFNLAQHSDLYETEAVARTLAENVEKELSHAA